MKILSGKGCLTVEKDTKRNWQENRRIGKLPVPYTCTVHDLFSLVQFAYHSKI